MALKSPVAPELGGVGGVGEDDRAAIVAAARSRARRHELALHVMPHGQNPSPGGTARLALPSVAIGDERPGCTVRARR